MVAIISSHSTTSLRHVRRGSRRECNTHVSLIAMLVYAIPPCAPLLLFTFSSQTMNNVYLVLDSMMAGDLYERIVAKGKYSEPDAAV